MSKPVSSMTRRTYFSHPLVEESLRFLPDAVDHPTSLGFRGHVTELLHYNSINARRRFAQYIAQRFSFNGAMNLDLARALQKYGASRTGREILYFEMLQASPVLLDIAALWLADASPEGAPREALLRFLEPRLGDRSAKKVAKEAVTAFRQCGKLNFAKVAVYVPFWTDPPLDAFLYMLVRLYPEATVVPVEALVGSPVFRGLLWRRSSVDGLLQAAWREGHLSKVSQLDQLYQFSLEGSGEERLHRLLNAPMPEGVREPEVEAPPPTRTRGKPKPKVGELL